MLAPPTFAGLLDEAAAIARRAEQAGGWAVDEEPVLSLAVPLRSTPWSCSLPLEPPIPFASSGTALPGSAWPRAAAATACSSVAPGALSWPRNSAA